MDFDDAHIGDRHEDGASLIAALPIDAPRLLGADAAPAAGERAVAAYPEGYQSAHGSRARRAAAARAPPPAGLAALASRLHKGRAGIAEAAAAVAALRAAVREG